MSLKTQKRERGRAKQRKTRRKSAEERREILVRHCLKMEEWGPRSGLAMLRFESLMYDPQVRQYHKVPGRNLSILIPDIGALDQSWRVLQAGMDAWMAGRWATLEGKFQCACGRLL